MKTTLRNYHVGLLVALTPIAGAAWAADYCHSFGDEGELASHYADRGPLLQNSEGSDFVSIFSAGACPRVNTINEGTPATLGVQLFSDGSNLAPGYPRGTIFG